MISFERTTRRSQFNLDFGTDQCIGSDNAVGIRHRIDRGPFNGLHDPASINVTFFPASANLEAVTQPPLPAPTTT